MHLLGEYYSTNKTDTKININYSNYEDYVFAKCTRVMLVTQSEWNHSYGLLNLS